MKASLGAVLTALLAALPQLASAQAQIAAADPTGFPCPGATASSVPPIGAPAIRVWTAAELAPAWVAPSCTGWKAGPVRLVISMTSRFRGPATIDDILARAGAISLLKDMKYWSSGRQRWTTMLSSAEALSGPDASQKRGDFSAAELRAGQSVYFLANASGPAGKAVFRTRAANVDATRATVELDNVTTVSVMGVTLFSPGDIRGFASIVRQADGSWVSHFLVRIDGKTNALLQGDGKSYVNRAAAYMRHLSGAPTDGEPPAMR